MCSLNRLVLEGLGLEGLRQDRRGGRKTEEGEKGEEISHLGVASLAFNAEARGLPIVRGEEEAKRGIESV